jgi:hypothetical protein
MDENDETVFTLENVKLSVSLQGMRGKSSGAWRMDATLPQQLETQPVVQKTLALEVPTHTSPFIFCASLSLLIYVVSLAWVVFDVDDAESTYPCEFAYYLWVTLPCTVYQKVVRVWQAVWSSVAACLMLSSTSLQKAVCSVRDVAISTTLAVKTAAVSVYLFVVGLPGLVMRFPCAVLCARARVKEAIRGSPAALARACRASVAYACYLWPVVFGYVSSSPRRCANFLKNNVAVPDGAVMFAWATRFVAITLAVVAIVACVSLAHPPVTHDTQVAIPAWLSTYESSRDLGDVPQRIQYLVLRDVMTQRQYPRVFDHVLRVSEFERQKAVQKDKELHALYEQSLIASHRRLKREYDLVFGTCSYSDKPPAANVTDIPGVTFTPRFYTRTVVSTGTHTPGVPIPASGVTWEYVQPAREFRVLSV